MDTASLFGRQYARVHDHVCDRLSPTEGKISDLRSAVSLFLATWRRYGVPFEGFNASLTRNSGLAIGALKGLNIIFGMFVAELHNHYKDSATSVLPAPVPALMILTGMFMAGYPQDSPQNAAWSHSMSTLMHSLTHKDSDVRRYWDHLGAATVLLGIFFSRNARRVLTSPVFNFLGRVSFPVYLMHNTLIKSVLTWMVYLPSAMNPPRNEKGEQMDLQRGSTTHIFIAVGVFYYILYRLAALWVAHIDPVCAKIVNAATRWAYGEQSPVQNTGPTLRRRSTEKPKTVLPS
jgi:peptidoglycan/LPS O-acetylase OafA/YrhL